MDERTIGETMTSSPHTIGVEQSLAAAARRMRELGVRHLPVLHGGKLVGMLSERDIAIIEALGGPRTAEMTVEEAMTPEPYVVPRDEQLRHVVRQMAAHKYGSAIVVDDERVVGLLTTIDALRLLAEALEGPAEERAAARRVP